MIILATQPVLMIGVLKMGDAVFSELKKLNKATCSRQSKGDGVSFSKYLG
jgi:hypothetical protein